MMMPDRMYSDTALTEEIVYTVSSYEKVDVIHEFDNSQEGWTKTGTSSTTTETERLHVEADAQNDWLYYKFDTDIGEDYRFLVTVTEGSCDSIKLRAQQVPSILLKELVVGSGTYELAFTAATVQTRLRIGRYDANKQGTLDFYIDRVVLMRVHDTIYQDTVRLAKGNGYRYGFNGMERDDKISGTGNSYTAEYWQYDSRLGRRWNTDPVVKPWESPYVCFLGNPIRVIDPNGDDGYVDEDGNYLGDDEDEESHETRVINADKWNEIVGETKSGEFTDEIRTSLQDGLAMKNKNGTRMPEPDEDNPNSKLLQEYENGISISDVAWEKLTDAGGGKLTPTVENNSVDDVFYKPEAGEDNPNPYVNYNEAVKIEPGKDLYSPVDGVSTMKYNDAVFKVAEDATIVVEVDGSVTPSYRSVKPDGWLKKGSWWVDEAGWGDLFDSANINGGVNCNNCDDD